MAITATSRGSSSHNTSALTFTLSPASDFASSTSWAVLVLSVDNSDSGGAAHSTFTVTDSLGNTWTRRLSTLRDPAGASAGVEGAMFTTPQNGGILTTGTTITVTFDANCTAKAWAMWEVTPTSGYELNFGIQSAGTGAGATSHSVASGFTLASGQIVIGGGAYEQGTTTAAGDADTTNGNWSADLGAQVGSGTSGTQVLTQYKVLTADGTQSYDTTIGTSSDGVLGMIVLEETLIPTTSLKDAIGCGIIPWAR
jgi:hypothetical protein